ncbi:hypothetical protein SAMN04490202_0207 [Pseudomonas reinekei]|jgi:hypothetical protein|uniref:Uncharacterized protein n=1 Tax=Pseudomonas reinekei TaxID=395598 RepID=A0A1H0HR85_PSERE|nr:hypothetical protein SAMN04490202_0207 [Pseudomonas reinekei]
MPLLKDLIMIPVWFAIRYNTKTSIPAPLCMFCTGHG